jgi:hypothetical protein
MLSLLIGLQAIQVAILWLHDWVPLSRLNDVAAVRAHDTLGRLIRVTIVQSLPFTIGLAASIAYALTGRPHWLWTWLWISYAILFAGEIRAWWWPYLVRRDDARAARYAEMFGRTSAFLPPHNGIVPNTLHTLLHASTAATLIVLGLVHGL